MGLPSSVFGMLRCGKAAAYNSGEVIHMAVDPLLQETKEHMEKSLHVLHDELQKLRGGRASPALVEGVLVDYYGTPTPLKHIAHLNAPEANLIVIRPFDPTQRQAIEKAILEANLGFNPVVAEDAVRIQVPHLSDERRKEMSKLVHERGEEAKVAIRNIRRHTKEQLEKKEKESALTEDDLERELQGLEKMTHEYCDKVDQEVSAKDKQLKSV